MTFSFEEKLDRLIDREILANQSYLVEDLLKNSPDYIEDIENLYDETDGTVLDYLTYETDLPEDTYLELNPNDRLELAMEHGFEPDYHEIFEWWLVSKWLADKLIGLKEPVLNNDLGVWWGRTCTGQAIKIDGVIRKIAQS